MSVGEFLLRVFSALGPMLPGIIVASVATLIALIVLMVRSRDMWVQDKRFRLLGLFFGLEGKGCLRLACSWLKMIFVIVFIASFQKLTLIHYLMLLIPGVIVILSAPDIKKKLGSFGWLLLQTVGLLSVNLICGYYLDMSGSVVYLLIYITMGIFLALFSVFLFLNDLATISLEREVDTMQVWGREQAEDQQTP